MWDIEPSKLSSRRKHHPLIVNLRCISIPYFVCTPYGYVRVNGSYVEQLETATVETAIKRALRSDPGAVKALRLPPQMLTPLLVPRHRKKKSSYQDTAPVARPAGTSSPAVLVRKRRHIDPSLRSPASEIQYAGMHVSQLHLS